MNGRRDLKDWVHEAVTALGGRAKIRDIAAHIWTHHEQALRKSNIFYSWQYDMRWAGQKLREEGKFGSTDDAPRGVWILKGYENK